MESHGNAVGGPRGHQGEHSITGNSIGCHLAPPADPGFGVSRGVHFGTPNWSIWELGPRNLVLRISRVMIWDPQIVSQTGPGQLLAMTKRTALPARAIGPAEGPPRYEGERGLSGVPTMRMHRTMESRRDPKQDLAPQIWGPGPHSEGLRAYMPEWAPGDYVYLSVHVPEGHSKEVLDARNYTRALPVSWSTSRLGTSGG